MFSRPKKPASLTLAVLALASIGVFVFAYVVFVGGSVPTVVPELLSDTPPEGSSCQSNSENERDNATTGRVVKVPDPAFYDMSFFVCRRSQLEIEPDDLFGHATKPLTAEEVELSPDEFLMARPFTFGHFTTRDDLLYRLATDFPELEGLHLIDCPLVTRAGLENLRFWPNLKYLQFGPGGQFDLQDLEVLEHLPITHLSLTVWVERLSGDRVRVHRLNQRAALAVTTLRNLEVLSFQTNAGADVAAEFASLRQLRVLDIGRMRDLDAWFDAIVSLHRLEWLRIDTPGLGDNHLKHFGRLTELRYLRLDPCNNLTDAALLGISKCKNLEHLHLMNGIGSDVTDAGVAHMDGMKLEELRLWGFKGLSDDVFITIETLTRLEVLDIWDAEGITGRNLGLVAELSRLHTLNLAWCAQLEPDALQALEAVTHDLTVNVRGCPKITADVTAAIEARNPHLKFLLD